MAQVGNTGVATGTENEHVNNPQTKSSTTLPEESGTTVDCMSNGDEDSDSYSIHSRRDSPDTTKGMEEANGSIVNDSSGERSRRLSSAEEPGLLGREAGGQSGHKRSLAEEERGQGITLRKACDLCTKRKRKCNGQQPCSQCIETGVRNQCVYSPRLKSGRKKKVRAENGSFDDGMGIIDGGGMGMALVANNRRQASADWYPIYIAAGQFSASGAVGLAGQVENLFLATYLRDFNRIVPLTTEGSVTEGMLEVLSRTVSSRGLSQASPIPQPEPRRQAKLAVFWGVVAMGSRILNAPDEATARYLTLMRAALRECFDSNDREVVQAYLLLSTVETMRGNEKPGKRYLEHARTMHNGNAMGPEGQLLKDRQEQEESLDLVFQIYAQPDGCVGQFSAETEKYMLANNPDMDASNSDGVKMGVGTRSGGLGHGRGESNDAVSEMIAQAMSPPSDSQSGPLKALKYLSTVCGLSSEVFDPTNKCVTVKQYLEEMDAALKGADSLFKHRDLSECITGVVMVKIWGGVTLVLRSWGKAEDKEMGLKQVEEGVGYALTRPGLMTFPMWWHALHSAAIVLAHFGHNDTYTRLRTTFNKNTFPDSEIPAIEDYSPGNICPQLGGSCSKLAHWLQVRGTMCGLAGLEPKFKSGLSEASENAAYAAALNSKFRGSCLNGAKSRGTTGEDKVFDSILEVLKGQLLTYENIVN